MKTYPTYKDSGVQWLGNIPTHWKIVKLRNLLHKTTQKDRPDLPLLSVVREQGVILRDIESKEENHNYIPDDLSNYKVLRDGQFVINKMKAWQGSYSVSSLTGIVSPAYFIYDLDYTDLIPQFFNTAIRSRAYIGFFNQASDGVRIGQWDLDEAQMRNIPLFVPSIEEQNAIVAYLDKKCAEIEELISRRQSIIERLRELKQSIIAEAVTKGLNPDVPMKDSGIAWLGEVPQHWNIERLQWHLREIKEINSPIKTNRVLSLTNKKGVIPYEEKGNQGNKAKASHDEYKLAYPDTLVMNSMNVIIGSVGICNYFGCVSPVYYIFKTAGETMLSFVNYVFQTTRFQKELRRHAKGILEIRLRLSSGDILKRLVAFPPLHEQQSIVAYLDKKCAEIDELVARQEQIIEKLKELKTSTIAHVVTGKVDVRDAI